MYNEVYIEGVSIMSHASLAGINGPQTVQEEFLSRLAGENRPYGACNINKDIKVNIPNIIIPYAIV